MAMFVSTYQHLANTGIYGLLIFIFIVLLINMVALWTPYQVRTEDTLTYTDAANLLQKTNIPLMYNENYSNGSPNSIVATIVA